MDLQLKGQKVLVFGAAQGIGFAIAKQFAGEGCRVIGLDRQDAPDADHIEFEQLDVTSQDQIERLAVKHDDTAHLVFAVGASSGKFGFPYWNVSPDDWHDVLDVNLIGAVRVAHIFGPLLTKHERGTLLFLTSVAGQIGSQTDPPYSAAKAALTNFMQCVAKDLAPFGVRANAISPGMVQTELNRSVWRSSLGPNDADTTADYERWAIEKIRRISPLARWQTVEEIAAMATFLASPHAANITGQTINIDGGQVMHA